MARQKCECSDPGCPAGHGSKGCRRSGTSILYRVDMEDESGTVFCSDCAEYALDSGLFTTESEDDFDIDEEFS